MIKDLKEFEKFLKICRKHGVTEVEAFGVIAKLNEQPISQSSESDASEMSPIEDLSPEALMYYSVGGTDGLETPQL